MRWKEGRGRGGVSLIGRRVGGEDELVVVDEEGKVLAGEGEEGCVQGRGWMTPRRRRDVKGWKRGSLGGLLVVLVLVSVAG